MVSSVAIFFSCLFLLSALPSASKPVLRGTVTERGNAGKPIEFANVTVFSERGRAMAFAATEENGRFAINLQEGGNYNLEVSCVGFVSFKSSLSIGTEEMVDLGNIALEPSSEEIAAASVHEKQILRKVADRIVYDVQADPDRLRLNMMEFMSKIPGLEMSHGKGRLEFREAALESILVDDKESGIINAKRQYPMSFIKANYMSRIELILPGSPEYNNDSPLLVIRLKEKLPYGAAAQIYMSGASSWSTGVLPDVVLNTPLLGIGISYRFNLSGSPELTDRTSRISALDGSSLLESEYKHVTSSWSHVFGVDLFRSLLKEKLDLKFSAGTSVENNLKRSSSCSHRADEGDAEASYLSSSTQRRHTPPRLFAGFRADYTWDNGNKLTVQNTFRHNYSSNEDRYYTFSEGVCPSQGSQDHLENNFKAAFVAKGDRKKNPGWRSYSSGGYMFRSYRNDYSSPLGFSGMEYRQGVAFLQESIEMSFFENKLIAGLTGTLEYTTNRGRNHTNGTSLDYDNFTPYPQFALIFRPGKTTRWHVGYTLHSLKPNARQLAGLDDRSDPNNIIKGNPELKKQVSNNLSAEFEMEPRPVWLSVLGVSVRWDGSRNVIQSYSFLGDNGVAVTTFGNITRSNRIQCVVSASLKPAKRLSMNLSANINYSTFSGKDIDNSFWSYSLDESFTYKSSWGIFTQRFNLSPFNLMAQTIGYKMNPLLSLSYSRFFKRINLGGEISFNDILHGRKGLPVTLMYDGVVETRHIGRAGREISLSVYWRIGRFREHGSVQHSSYDLAP